MSVKTSGLWAVKYCNKTKVSNRRIETTQLPQVMVHPDTPNTNEKMSSRSAKSEGQVDGRPQGETTARTKLKCRWRHQCWKRGLFKHSKLFQINRLSNLTDCQMSCMINYWNHSLFLVKGCIVLLLSVTWHLSAYPVKPSADLLTKSFMHFSWQSINSCSIEFGKNLD